jgi:hypothetical protein
VSTVKTFLDAYEDAVWYTDGEGRRTVLHTACEAGSSVEAFRELLRARPDLATALTRDGSTPLHFARDAAVATVLLDCQGSVLEKNQAGRIPLHGS